MPTDPNSPVEIVTFDWVPDFARGYVRDFRVRWALEEAGIAYRTRPISAAQRPASHFADQPFGQVPAYRDDTVRMFESGAIVLHIAEASEALLPLDPAQRARAQCWMVAALNSVEPMLMELTTVDLFARGEPWADLRRPSLVEAIRTRLGQLETALGDRDYLEGGFTAGDLLMASALRALDHTELLAEHPRLAAYQQRCLARPGFVAAIAAQLAEFDARPVETA
ncbi:glutathione S-transferase family protein [Sphingomonas hengshuiensis]|uniref:Glutathione S-transferase n=1 Tax=Sphingomonas hengshuiensis TaxID=1609977 RepID=A0A7U5BEH4_9SPHN|nr:glutathione S-transferase family protein [Sphingomonas hengshuiensis]AJP70738.1 glutathione S-transferase [Sphingomonas hengshuiensis]